MTLTQYEKKEENENLYGFLIWGGWEMGSHLPVNCNFSKLREIFSLLLENQNQSEGIKSLQTDTVMPENTI